MAYNKGMGLADSPIFHPWEVTPKEAIAIQNELRRFVICEDQIDVLRCVAGIDVGFEEGGRISQAAVVALRFPELEIVETVVARRATSFPYVPGLLSFREVPVILEALSRLSAAPDLLFCDGQGYAHPRRCGLACHLGLATGLPAIGVAKSRLIGEHQVVGEERGAWQPLIDDGEVIGAALRTRVGAKPVFVSIGHKVSLETAIDLTIGCTGSYRIPEPTRLAHMLASKRDGP
jgi:deoxyribonuclease V